jgi:hypothetical protein
MTVHTQPVCASTGSCMLSGVPRAPSKDGTQTMAARHVQVGSRMRTYREITQCIFGTGWSVARPDGMAGTATCSRAHQIKIRTQNDFIFQPPQTARATQRGRWPAGVSRFFRKIPCRSPSIRCQCVGVLRVQVHGVVPTARFRGRTSETHFWWTKLLEIQSTNSIL